MTKTPQKNQKTRKTRKPAARKSAAKAKPKSKDLGASHAAKEEKTTERLVTKLVQEPEGQERVPTTIMPEAKAATAPQGKAETEVKTTVDDAAKPQAVVLTLKQIELIAEVCHMRNRGYCLSIGDASQPHWDEAPDWMKDSAIAGVNHAVNEDATPEMSHENWCAVKEADGWRYGEVKDAEAKTHPCLVPYDQLPDEQKRKDEIFLETVRVGMTSALGADNVELIATLYVLDWFDIPAPAKADPEPEVKAEPDLPMLLRIDVVSYAAAAAHQAAQRIYDLLSDVEANWFDDSSMRASDDVSAYVLEMCGYIASRPAPLLPETLYRKAAEKGFHHLHADQFASQYYPLRAAYAVFADVAGRLIDWLEDEQGKLRDALAAQTPPEPVTHNRADSVLEPHGGGLDKHRLSGAVPEGGGKQTLRTSAAPVASSKAPE